MSIKRYGLGRECTHGVGQPTIIERPDGEYVRIEDYEAVAKKLAVAQAMLKLADDIAAHRVSRDKERIGLTTEILECPITTQ